MENLLNFISENSTLFIAGVIILVLLILFIVFVIQLNKKDVNDNDIILRNLTTPRIFVLNLNEMTVSYFDRGQYAARKSGPLNQFFEQFTANEVESLERWINDVIIPKSGAHLFYKVDVFVRNMRRSYASILEVTKIDYEKKIIHLESFLYRYLKPNNQMNLTVKKKESVGYIHGSTLGRLYQKYALRGKGLYGAINIMSITNKNNSGDLIPPHIWYELQNLSAFYRSKNLIIRFNDSYTVGLYSPSSTDVTQLMNIIQKIVRRMRAYLEKNGHDEYSIAYGIARAKQFNDMKMCIKTAEELSIYAHRQIGKSLIHDPNQEVKDLDLSLYRNELSNIVAKKSVEAHFQPLVDAHNVEILGYIASFHLHGSLFTNYSELSTFARENKLDESLVRMSLRKTVANYHNMRRLQKQLLFIPLRVDSIEYLEDIFTNQTYAKDIKLVFMLDEYDIGNSFDSVDNMLEAIGKIKALGHQVTIVISDTELTLPDKIYGEVDFFMVNDRILSYTVGDERERLYLLASLGKLLRHKRPIVIIDLPKWSEIEYYIRAGIDYIASDEISKKEVSLQTIDKKKALKIINFSKRK